MSNTGPVGRISGAADFSAVQGSAATELRDTLAGLVDGILAQADAQFGLDGGLLGEWRSRFGAAAPADRVDPVAGAVERLQAAFGLGPSATGEAARGLDQFARAAAVRINADPYRGFEELLGPLSLAIEQAAADVAELPDPGAALGGLFAALGAGADDEMQ